MKKYLKKGEDYYKNKISKNIIYAIKMENRNIYKIGHSANINTLKRRLTSLQSGNPYNLTIYKTIKKQNAERFERLIHRELKNYRMSGEWFKVTKKHLNEAMTLMTLR